MRAITEKGPTTTTSTAARGVALFGAMLFAAALLLVVAAQASAFGVSSFKVTPSTTQAAGHATVSVEIKRTGTLIGEDIRDIVAELPPGLLANAEATTKCPQSSFTRDRCSSLSQVGDVSIQATALGLLPLTASGVVELLQPDATDPATLGYIIRPPTSSFGIINKIYLKNHIAVRSDSDYGLTSLNLGIPKAASIFSFIHVPITINTMKFSLNARANSSKTGRYFEVNPSSCTPAVSRLRVTSHSNQVATAATSFTPTGCANVPLSASLSAAMGSTHAGAFTGGTITASVPQADAPIQHSNISDAVITFPKGTGLNLALVSTLTGCTQAQFAGDTCPVASEIGQGSAIIPPLPPAVTGKLYILDPLGSTVGIGLSMSGARGIKARLQGTARVIGESADSQLVVEFHNIPQVPLGNLNFQFTKPLLKNPETCGTQTINAVLTGHSGATANAPASYVVTNCPPETTITGGPGGLTGDSTPTFTFTASLPGATFTCQLDAGTPAPCTSPHTTPPLSDGPHTISVLSAVGADVEPVAATRSFTVDTAPPALNVTSPTSGELVGESFVAVEFDAEAGASSTCAIDATPATPCVSPHGIAGLDDGPHVVTVTAVDAAGNSSSQSVPFNVLVGGGGSTFDADIETGPRGGLAITDRTPTYTFGSLPPGATGFECRVDGGVYAACASPHTLGSLANGPHSFEVRAVSTPDDDPAVATFTVGDFAPTFDVDFSTMQAGSHPVVDVTINNPAGQPRSAVVDLPNGTWGSLGAAPLCSQSDLAARSCPVASRVGAVDVTAVTDENDPVTIASDVYLAAGTPGSIVNLAGYEHVFIGGDDYGFIDVQFKLNLRRTLNPGGTFDVENNPVGLTVSANDVPHSLSGPAGTREMHIRSIGLSIDGGIGAPAHPLLILPSTCLPLSVVANVTDYESNTASPTQTFSATGCELLPFEPTIDFTHNDPEPDGTLTLQATVSLPLGSATFRRATIDLPESVVPNYIGLADDCPKPEMIKSPPNCDLATIVGSAVIETPMLPTPQTGTIYLERSGGALPFVHAVVVNPVIGFEVRLRLAARIVEEPAPGHIRVRTNVRQNGTDTDVPSFPITSLALDLPGGTNGPIGRLSTECKVADSATGVVTTWAGTTKTITQDVAFSPNCPN